MEIIKVAGIGILGVIIAGLLRKDKPEFALVVTIATGIIVLVLILSSMTKAVTAFDALVEKTGVDQALFGGVLKIIGIGYLTEYSAAICTDYGSQSIANKVQLAGKIAIFLMAMPIISSLIDVVSSLL